MKTGGNMAEVRPYQTEYFNRRKKLISLAVLAILALAAAGLAAWYFHSRSRQDGFVGRVVRISGSIDDIGLVKTFREGKSIRYYSAASGFKDLVYHNLQSSDSIKIVARDAAAYLKKTRKEREIPAEPAAAGAGAPAADESLPPPMDVVPGDSEPEEYPPVRSDKTFGAAEPAERPSEPAKRNDEGAVGYTRSREQGVREYDRWVGRLAAKADEIDTLWKKYHDFCQGTIAVTVGNVFGREWFGIYTTINAADTPECKMMIQDMQVLAAEIDTGMESAWEQAHRAGVYPGQIRAIQQKHRMELDRWNK
jgi:hypothetical protein